MSKRYSKEEVVELINSYREHAWINGNDWSSYIKWAKDNGFPDEPTNKRKQYSVQDEIERKERIVALKDTAFDIEGFIHEHLNKGLKDMCDKNDKSYTPAMDYNLEINLINSRLDNTPSLDKVMEAIDRVEDRGRMNSKHILTLQQAVNTLSDIARWLMVEQTNE